MNIPPELEAYLDKSAALLPAEMSDLAAYMAGSMLAKMKYEPTDANHFLPATYNWYFWRGWLEGGAASSIFPRGQDGLPYLVLQAPRLMVRGFLEFAQSSTTIDRTVKRRLSFKVRDKDGRVRITGAAARYVLDVVYGSETNPWPGLPDFAENVAKVLEWRPKPTQKEADASARRAMLTKTPEQLEALKMSPSDMSALFQDGPPCLECLARDGSVREPHRPLVTINIAAYAKRAHPDDWQTKTRELATAMFGQDDPSLACIAQIKGLPTYTCSKQPLYSHCNPVECRRRQFGVPKSVEEGRPQINRIQRLETDPPIWYVQMDEDERWIELETDQLLNPKLFVTRVCEVINIVLPRPTEKQWNRTLHDLMPRVETLSAPKSGSHHGVFLEHLRQFCRSRARASVKDEILRGQVWTEDGRHWFEVSGLTTFLHRNNFRAYQSHQMANALAKAGGIFAEWEIGGLPTEVWGVPEYAKAKKKEELEEGL
jgi:hypothetical protein